MKKKLFHLSILTAFILLFTNCKNDDDSLNNYLLEENITHLNETLGVGNSFNSKYINKSLELGKGNFQVNWSDYKIINFSKRTNITTYEFNAYLNKDILNNSKLFKSKIIYKLIMSIDNKNQSEYKILRFEPFKYSQNINPSSLDLNNFSGMKFILNENGKIDDILTYNDGLEIASLKH